MKSDKVYLVGFMAAGKTTVARALARRLGWQAVDIDEAIEQRERQTVAEIFSKQGEGYFRAAERQALLDRVSTRHLVVATGGGTFVDPQNRAAINADGVSVWLDVSLDRLIDRVPADGRRPLAADRAGFERLYYQRRAAYEQAHVRLDAGRASVDALVEQLVDWLEALMRYLVLTDIHANLEALDACIADARARGFDQTLVLGDLVGYGGDPNAVVERIQSLKPVAIVRGNHDKVACGLEQAEGFNAVAKRAAKWTLDVLKPAHRDWLAALPEGPIDVDGIVEICHGSPFDEDAYIFDDLDAVRALKVSNRQLCLFGHTHYPVTFELSDDSFDNIGAASPQVQMKDGCKYLINPGSVGQPRDGDPRAAYAIVDTSLRRVELYRIRYAVEDAQNKVVKAGLPDVLAQRLAVGR